MNNNRKKFVLIMAGVVGVKAINRVLINRERRHFFLDGSEQR